MITFFKAMIFFSLTPYEWHIKLNFFKEKLFIQVKSFQTQMNKLNNTSIVN